MKTTVTFPLELTMSPDNYQEQWHRFVNQTGTAPADIRQYYAAYPDGFLWGFVAREGSLIFWEAENAEAAEAAGWAETAQ